MRLRALLVVWKCGDDQQHKHLSLFFPFSLPYPFPIPLTNPIQSVSSLLGGWVHNSFFGSTVPNMPVYSRETLCGRRLHADLLQLLTILYRF